MRPQYLSPASRLWREIATTSRSFSLMRCPSIFSYALSAAGTGTETYASSRTCSAPSSSGEGLLLCCDCAAHSPVIPASSTSFRKLQLESGIAISLFHGSVGHGMKYKLGARFLSIQGALLQASLTGDRALINHGPSARRFQTDSPRRMYAGQCCGNLRARRSAAARRGASKDARVHGSPEPVWAAERCLAARDHSHTVHRAGRGADLRHGDGHQLQQRLGRAWNAC